MNKYIKRTDLQRSPQILFIFGDNDLRVGLGGVAKEFRGEPNALGIRTKKAPSLNKEAFYTDKEYEKNMEKIKEDIDTIKKEAKKYCAIWIPDKIGAGLAKMEEKAPKTYIYLLEKIEELKGLFK